jgi:hypothetical protein
MPEAFLFRIVGEQFLPTKFAEAFAFGRENQAGRLI